MRCFASAASTTHHDSHKAILPELAGPPSKRPWQAGDRKAQTTTSSSTSPSSRFYIPAVHIPAEAAKKGPVHKIHILGDDARSRFIAHALCGVYNSVELLGMRTMPKSRYRNVEKVGSDKSRAPIKSEANAALVESQSKNDKSRIDELVVTGRGYEAVEAVKSVKERLDEKTTICLMNDGMGVLEDIREEIFNGSKKEPNFILGHMSHSLVYNRKSNSVKELRGGQTLLTEIPTLREDKELDLASSHLLQQPSMLSAMQQLNRLRVSSTPYDEWLRFKLPSMIFTAVVEPVCVLLDSNYKGLLDNPSARRLLHQLLEEIIVLVENLPEVQESASLLRYLQGPAIKKLCFKKIMGKATAPSELLTRVNRGLETDINYQNGYFLRRAKKLGLDLPVNRFMAQLVSAKREDARSRIKSFIPMEEKSHAAFFTKRT